MNFDQPVVWSTSTRRACFEVFSTAMKEFRPMELNFDTPSAFQDRLVPKGTRLAGWAALVNGLGIAAPVRAASAVAGGHIKGSHRAEASWTIFDKRYWPGDGIAAHISFPLSHERFEPPIFKRVFHAVGPDFIAPSRLTPPTG